MKEDNRTLRVMLETLSSKCEKLQSHLQEINNEEQQVGTKSDQSGSVLLARPEFSMAQKPSQIFFKTHPKDNSLVCLLIIITCVSYHLVNAQIYTVMKFIHFTRILIPLGI